MSVLLESRVLLTVAPGVLDGLFIVWHCPEISWPVVSSCETVVVTRREVYCDLELLFFFGFGESVLK